MSTELNDVYYRLGLVEARIGNLEATSEQTFKWVGEIRDTLAEIRGGKRFALSLAAFIGSMVTLITSWFVGRHA